MFLLVKSARLLLLLALIIYEIREFYLTLFCLCLLNAFIKKVCVQENQNAETQTFADNILEICVIDFNTFSESV